MFHKVSPFRTTYCTPFASWLSDEMCLLPMDSTFSNIELGKMLAILILSSSEADSLGMTRLCPKLILLEDVCALQLFVKMWMPLAAPSISLASPKQGRPLSIYTNTNMAANPNNNLIFIYEAIVILLLFIAKCTKRLLFFNRSCYTSHPALYE